MLTRRQLLTLPAALPAAAATPPNILLILADDLGSADLSSTGAPDIRTPHLDSIAAQGIRFTRAYCNAPECTPSRAALLTGRYQQRVGGLECAIGVGNVGRYDDAIWLAERHQLGLPASEISLAQLLKERGYDTACIGKWHLGYTREFSPAVHGFDEYYGILGGNAGYFSHTEENGANVLYHNAEPVHHKGYLTDLLAGAALQWLARRTNRPWFLYLPFTAPHSPFQSPSNDAGKSQRQIYAEMVQSIDHHTGRILAQLDRMKTTANTWVIFLSDNGGPRPASNQPLRGFKSSVWEGGIRMPCFMRWPRFFQPGSQTSQVTLMMDITASLLAAVGVNPPRPLDGLDLLSVWQGRRPVTPRTVFWRFRRLSNTCKAVLHGDWKLVDDNGKQELHHLISDPREESDQLSNQPTIAADLRARLAAWEKDVSAPRLEAMRSTRH